MRQARAATHTPDGRPPKPGFLPPAPPPCSVSPLPPSSNSPDCKVTIKINAKNEDDDSVTASAVVVTPTAPQAEEEEESDSEYEYYTTSSEEESSDDESHEEQVDKALDIVELEDESYEEEEEYECDEVDVQEPPDEAEKLQPVEKDTVENEAQIPVESEDQNDVENEEQATVETEIQVENKGQKTVENEVKESDEEPKVQDSEVTENGVDVVANGFANHDERVGTENGDSTLDSSEGCYETVRNLEPSPADELGVEESGKPELPRMVPKIPAFVKSDPPCDFLNDPQSWIQWMEKEVSDYKNRKAEEDRKRREEIERQTEEKIRQELQEATEEMEVKEAFEDVAAPAPAADEITEVCEPMDAEEGDEDDEWEWEDDCDVVPADEDPEKEIEAVKDDAIDWETAAAEDKTPVSGITASETESSESKVVMAESMVEEPAFSASKEDEASAVIKEDETTPVLEETAPLEAVQEEEDSKQGVDREERDPMEVLEKMKQLRRNKVLQRPNSSQEVGNPNDSPHFMRQKSNPEAKARPMSIANDSNLDDMLDRIKKLRAERHQILKDMSMIKNAFGISEDAASATAGDDENKSNASTPTSDHVTADSGFGTQSNDENELKLPTVKSRKRSDHSSVCSDASDHVYCFICGMDLGRLSKGAAMHMGLEDGEPICPDALHLTEESRQKIMNIAMTTNFDLRWKYEMLETLDLDLYGGTEEYDISAKDVLNRVETFLDDVELQKERDREEFDAIRSGAIDDIWNAEFGLGSTYTESSDADVTMDVTIDEDMDQDTDEVHEEEDEQSLAQEEVPPVITPDSRKELMLEIQRGKLLKQTMSKNDKSDPIDVGRVLHKHIAPRVFSKEIRKLMHDINKSERKLRKVKTSDRSAPYIPKDMEIYFYAGPNNDRTRAPPPASKPIPSKAPSPPKESYSEKRTKHKSRHKKDRYVWCN